VISDRALEGLLGEDAAGLSASTVSRLCKEREAHHDRSRQLLLSFRRYAYLLMDGIRAQVRPKPRLGRILNSEVKPVGQRAVGPPT
jgi:putative transposase